MNKTLFPDPPPRPEPELVAQTGPWGGPNYRYRGARIECYPGGHVCGCSWRGTPATA